MNTDKDIGNVSDGYHTFNELYDHRCHLFIGLLKSNPEISWRAKKHSDGTCYESWFIAGMDLSSGQITYHLPLWMWDMLDNTKVKTFEIAPEWDGHTPQDVVDRLAKWIKE